VRFLLPLLIAGLFGVRAIAQSLPDLGDASQAVFSPALERRLGESIMERVRADRSYLDDPITTDYLNALGNRLAAASPDTRQRFDFFFMQDPSVNAFALPGGFIGVHAGLILTAQTESELAGVLAHEVAHVTQRHIARMIESQERNQLASLAALAIGLLAARANSQVAQAVIAGSQAVSIQGQLDFSRDNEREADRVGAQILEKAGLDVHAMPIFMERLQRATRAYETSAPAYLRTHPITTERIADLQNRTEPIAYKQISDNIEFQFVRARVRAYADDPRQALTFFEQGLKERRYINEAATRYGLTIALMRMKEFARARREFALLEPLAPKDAAVSVLKGELLRANGDTREALAHYAGALAAHPGYRALVYDYTEALISNRQSDAALRVLEQQLTHTPQDARLYGLLAKSYAGLGQRLLQHQAQAEYYLRRGLLGAAIEQLQIALRAGDGDFYQLSAAEARLRELRARLKETEKRKP
jgi:predicted Zn-dependent protease